MKKNIIRKSVTAKYRIKKCTHRDDTKEYEIQYKYLGISGLWGWQQAFYVEYLTTFEETLRVIESLVERDLKQYNKKNNNH